MDLVPFPVFLVQRFVGGAGLAELGGGVGEGGVFFGGDVFGGFFEVGVGFPSFVGGGGGHEQDVSVAGGLLADTVDGELEVLLELLASNAVVVVVAAEPDRDQVGVGVV